MRPLVATRTPFSTSLLPTRRNACSIEGQRPLVDMRLSGLPIAIAFITAPLLCSAVPPQATWDDMHPTFSPDGRTIAFTSNRSGRFQLYTFRLADSVLRRVTTSAGADYWPSWSPDGLHLVFDSNRDGNQELYVVTLATGEQRRLTTDTSAFDAVASWSPRGDRIAFDSNRRPDGAADLWVAGPTGADQRALWSDSLSDGHPSWSPDGRYLAYKTGPLHGTTPRPSEIAVVDLTTGARRTLTNNGGVNVSPTWSRDGARIAFASRRGASLDLYEIGADGAGERRLTDDPGDEYRPSYSADGRSIVYASRRQGRWSLQLLELGTSRVGPLVSSEIKMLVPELPPFTPSRMRTLQVTVTEPASRLAHGRQQFVTGSERPDVERGTPRYDSFEGAAQALHHSLCVLLARQYHDQHRQGGFPLALDGAHRQMCFEHLWDSRDGLPESPNDIGMDRPRRANHDFRASAKRRSGHGCSKNGTAV